MKVKHMMMSILNRSANFRALNYRRKIQPVHRQNEVRKVTDKKKPIYYVISYDDPQSSGWTVWERVVLYGSIYAEDHGMIPVVDMKDHRNTYQEEDDYQKLNVWDEYFLQPGGVSLETAIASENYILADTSAEWFNYVRMRTSKRFTIDFLRDKYDKYIKLRPEIKDYCEKEFENIFIDKDKKNRRMIGVVLRGTDYVAFHHSTQPTTNDIVNLAIKKFKEFNCDYFYVSTEDKSLFEDLKTKLPSDKFVSYKAGQVGDTKGELINKWIRKQKGAREEALDYITKLYIINKCCCLVGGKCGATIVAEYRRKPPYEYINIIDFNTHY